MSSIEKAALRGKVAALVKLGYSYSRIAKEVKINENTAQKWKRQCLADEKSFLVGPQYSHRGNPKFSAREMKTIMDEFSQMQPLGSDSAAAEISAQPHHQKTVSGRTLRRKARSDRFHPYIPPPKPELSKAHKRERFAFAKNHRDTEFSTWNFNDQFKVPFPMRRSARTPHWAKKRSQVKPRGTKKFPPSLNIHAGITRKQTLPLIFFDGPMNSEKFRQVNEEHIPRLCDAFEGHEFFYQHDRSPWFTSAATQRYFQEETPASVHVISPSEFPPNSPDLNLCENEMATVLKRVAARKPRSIEQMREFLAEKWLAVTPAELEALYDSMGDRLKQVRAKKGGNTDY